MSETNAIEQSPGSGMKVLDRNALKYIVIVAMVIDHLAWAFPEQLGTTLCAVMHFIGRLTGPTMAFFLAEGYKYTSNKAKYQARLGIFALISWLPFVFFRATPNISENLTYLITQSVIFTLFLGITALIIYESDSLSKGNKAIFIIAFILIDSLIWVFTPFPIIAKIILTIPLIVAIILVAIIKHLYFPIKVILIIVLTLFSAIGDWPFADVLGPFFLYVFRNNKKAKYLSVSIVFGFITFLALFSESDDGTSMYLDFAGKWYNFGILLVPVMIWLFYNGKGGKKSAFNKWFFYIFYPAHLVVLGILKLLILK